MRCGCGRNCASFASFQFRVPQRGGVAEDAVGIVSSNLIFVFISGCSAAGSAPALGSAFERVLRTIERKCAAAAVEIVRALRVFNFGYRNVAAQPRMP